ncbi:MAG: hypothetical protein QOG14_425 [Mycobacterium sp.]|nr:hypothetical protein [Mycobacterium sp.]
MFSGVIRQLPAAVSAVAFLVSAAVLPGHTAAADPDQDQKFFDLLGQKEIPPVDNANSLIETAHKACSKLDGGMSVGDLVDLIRNNGYNENPLTRLNPADRITRTIDQFIIASVEAYCPYDRGKIASIAAHRAAPSGEPTYRVTAYAHDAAASRGLILASLVGTVPAGDIAPTKPLPVPAAPPPPEAPAQVVPAPQQPPPPPRHVQQAPQRQQQVEPPPQEAPPQEAPPQAEQPQAPAPAPEPGGGNGGAPAPESPPPAPPAPPGHIRLAP